MKTPLSETVGGKRGRRCLGGDSWDDHTEAPAFKLTNGGFWGSYTRMTVDHINIMKIKNWVRMWGKMVVRNT